jgi:hypothetical protein
MRESNRVQPLPELPDDTLICDVDLPTRIRNPIASLRAARVLLCIIHVRNGGAIWRFMDMRASARMASL